MSGCVLVTGALGGIGRAIARQAAGKRMRIGLLDIEGTRDRAFEAALLADGAERVHFEACDLALVDAHAPCLGRMESALGPVGHLVNNAGIGAPVRGDMLDMPAAAFDKVMDVNLRGTFFLTQEVARRMLADTGRQGGSIVTVSSVSAEMVSVERAEYCLSKAALPMLTQLFAARLAAHGIGVFEIRPGIIRTPMTEKVSERYEREIAGGLVPARRWGEPRDVACAVAMFWNPDVSFATGTTVDVAGGLSIPRL